MNYQSSNGQELYYNIASHLAFRLLPNDAACKVPDIYIMSTVSYPFANEFIYGNFGKNNPSSKNI